MLLFFGSNSALKSLKDFPEECFTAALIYDESRVFGTFDPMSRDDLQLKKGWYRFSGRSANSLKEGFHTVAVPVSSEAKLCGGVYAGTLMSSHPTVEEGVVSMVVCFRERKCYAKGENLDGCKCKSKKTIYVRNCQRHFIYWLVPTARHERYCTSKTWLSKPVKSVTESDAIECTQHKVIQDGSRIWNSQSYVIAETEEGWVRFGATAGGEMASQCTKSSQRMSQVNQPCGAYFRGWMNATHPVLSEGRVMRRVCFSYPDQCSCEIFSDVSVRNCGKFYVYHLNKPPLDKARYCGAALKSSAPKKITATVDDDSAKNICNSTKSLTGIDRLWGYTDPTVSKCDANLYGVYKFIHKNIPLTIKEGCNKTDMLVIESRCSGTYQGFIEGRHPTVSEGYVKRIVCFQYNRVPCECHATTIIGVQNCGDSFAYELKGVPLCDSRFCLVVHPDKPADVGLNSIYGSSTSYEPSLARTEFDYQKSASESDSNSNIVTLLGLVLIFLIIFLILLIIVAVCVIRPLAREKRKEQALVQQQG